MILDLTVYDLAQTQPQYSLHPFKTPVTKLVDFQLK